MCVVRSVTLWQGLGNGRHDLAVELDRYWREAGAIPEPQLRVSLLVRHRPCRTSFKLQGYWHYKSLMLWCNACHDNACTTCTRVRMAKPVGRSNVAP